MRRSDVELGASKVKISFKDLKGQVRKEVNRVEMEALHNKAITVRNAKYGEIPLCPVMIMKIALDRAQGGADAPVFKQTYSTYIKSVNVLVEKAGIPNKVEGRNRHCYTAHSSRVGGVCMLLAAGLSETVVSTICAWKGDSVRRYSEMLALEPSRVEPYAFYNPVGLKKCYT